MKLTEQQKFFLLIILRDTLPICNGFIIAQQSRIEIFEKIIAQQED